MLLWNAHFSLIQIWLVLQLLLFLASNDSFMHVAFSFLNNACSAFCRLFLARRWLHRSLLFLTWPKKFVMQSKHEQSKVLDNLSCCISCFVINCGIGHLTWLIAPDKNHGVILLPEGLIESIPEVYALLKVITFVSPSLAAFGNVSVVPKTTVPNKQSVHVPRIHLHTCPDAYLIFLCQCVCGIACFSFPMKGSPEILCTSQEIHSLLKQGVAPDSISSQLSPWASALLEFLPPFIKREV